MERGQPQAWLEEHSLLSRACLMQHCGHGFGLVPTHLQPVSPSPPVPRLTSYLAAPMPLHLLFSLPRMPVSPSLYAEDLILQSPRNLPQQPHSQHHELALV